MSDKKQDGPVWHLEQQLKAHTEAAKAWRADIARYLEKAERADVLVEEYREALQKLLDK